MPFGKGILAFGVIITAMSTAAAVASLLVEGDSLQLAIPALVMVAGVSGLYLRSRRRSDLSPEVVMQVAVSISTYAVVWVAACGYLIAGIAGPSLDSSRTVALHACVIGMLLTFSFLLARSAIKSRQQHYGLGLAVSPVLAGMLLPVLDWHFVYPLVHGLMAVGYLAAVAIQSAQLRQAVSNHASD